MLKFTQELHTLIAARLRIDKHNHWYDIGRWYGLDNKGARLLLLLLLLLPFTHPLLFTARNGHIGFIVHSYGGFEIAFGGQFDNP